MLILCKYNETPLNKKAIFLFEHCFFYQITNLNPFLIIIIFRRSAISLVWTKKNDCKKKAISVFEYCFYIRKIF